MACGLCWRDEPSRTVQLMPFEPKPASEQGRLTLGERLCDLRFRDAKDEAVSLYQNRLFGWPKVIHVAASPEDAEPELVRLAERVHSFASVETHVFGVTRARVQENAALVRRLKLPFPLLSHEEGCLHRAAGLDEGAAPCTLVFDAVLRLEKVIASADVECQAEAALAHAEARYSERRPMVITEQAPALAIPNLIDPEHCRRLIAFWEGGSKIENLVMSKTGKISATPKLKSRADVAVPVGSYESDELVGIMCRRLLPEISKAFNFEVTRFEPFKVGCYDAADRGFFGPHRDNARDITKHRRYALTLNLNTGEYEGGFLRLPEYGPHLYAPPVGAGIVFSCSLLHLATPVTKGRRFVLVGFFWGEEEQPVFERSHADMFPGGTDINLISQVSTSLT
ncbi:MAG: 2OG-Fe(II) oxygenase [Alphaproteobacteria bacterium]